MTIPPGIHVEAASLDSAPVHYLITDRRTLIERFNTITAMLSLFRSRSIHAWRIDPPLIVIGQRLKFEQRPVLIAGHILVDQRPEGLAEARVEQHMFKGQRAGDDLAAGIELPFPLFPDRLILLYPQGFSGHTSGGFGLSFASFVEA